MYLWDANGKRYLDFLSGIGVNALGHRHPAVRRAIRAQSDKLIHISNLYFHEYQSEFAKQLTKTFRPRSCVLLQQRNGGLGRRLEDRTGACEARVRTMGVEQSGAFLFWKIRFTAGHSVPLRRLDNPNTVRRLSRSSPAFDS